MKTCFDKGKFTIIYLPPGTVELPSRFQYKLKTGPSAGLSCLRVLHLACRMPATFRSLPIVWEESTSCGLQEESTSDCSNNMWHWPAAKLCATAFWQCTGNSSPI
eukprot:1494054-Rhodomonas_salina.4